MANKGIVWIKLDSESKRDLIVAAGQAYPKLFADHVTLAFEVFKGEFMEIMDKKVTFVATEVVQNGKIQAARVSLPEWVKSRNNMPHITISSMEGVPPKMSNEMFESGIFEARSLGDGLELAGTIEFFEFKSRG